MDQDSSVRREEGEWVSGDPEIKGWFIEKERKDLYEEVSETVIPNSLSIVEDVRDRVR